MEKCRLGQCWLLQQVIEDECVNHAVYTDPELAKKVARDVVAEWADGEVTEKADQEPWDFGTEVKVWTICVDGVEQFCVQGPIALYASGE